MANLTRWNPIRSTLWDRDPFSLMDRMMETALDRNLFDWNTTRSWGLPLDVVEQDDVFVVRASIPGIDPNDIDVTLTDNVLTIQAQTKQEHEEKEGERYVMRERQYGSFTRSISLPMPVEADKIEATCSNGELTLTLPKAEAVRPRRISITGATGKNVIEGQVQSTRSQTTPESNGGNGQGWSEGQAAGSKSTAQ